MIATCRLAPAALVLALLAGACGREPALHHDTTAAEAAAEDTAVAALDETASPIPAELAAWCAQPVAQAVKVEVPIKGLKETVPFIRIPAGCFWHGCNDEQDPSCHNCEKPGRMAWLPEYEIMETEFTWREWHLAVQAGHVDPEFLGYKPGPNRVKTYGMCQTPASGGEIPDKPDFPACMSYSFWPTLDPAPLLKPDRLCQHMFEGGGLASEAEVEKAGRGGCETTPEPCAANARIYPWGQEPDWCTALTEPDFPVDPFDPGTRRKCMSLTGGPVRSHPMDVSVYGVWDLAGNMGELALLDLVCLHEDSGLACKPASDGMLGARLPSPGVSHYDDQYAAIRAGPGYDLSTMYWGKPQVCGSHGFRLSARTWGFDFLMGAGFRCVRRLPAVGRP